MGLKAELAATASAIITTRRVERVGRTVPEPGDITFIGAEVKLDAVFLYADLRDSTSLATRNHDAAADVFQVFLHSMCRIIRSEGGEIRSFDGDRVMAVFIGPDCCDVAARCAMKMNWGFTQVVKPKLSAAWPTSLAGFDLEYCAGIDAGSIWAVNGGVRGDNDIVWIGRAPNLAAKLSAMSEGYRTYITSAVFDRLSDSMKYGGSPVQSMWESRTWSSQGGIRVYRSNFWWSFT